MALPLPKLIPDVGPGGPFVTALSGVNALHDQMLQRKMQELKNQYYGPRQEAEIQHQNLVNQYYGPNIESEMAQRSAQTNRLNTLTPLEAAELKLKNQFYPDLTRAQIQNYQALSNQRNLGSAGMGTGGKEELFFQKLVGLDNPQLKPEQIYEASNVLRQGGNQLSDGTPIRPLSPAAQSSFDRITKGTTTSSLVTSGVRTNQAEAEIQALAKHAQEGIKPYGTSYLGRSGKAILDSFKSDKESQERLGRFLGARQLQFEIAQNEIKLAMGQPGITQTNELLDMGMQNIKADFPRLSGTARQAAQNYFMEGLLKGKKARDEVPIQASSLLKPQKPGSALSSAKKDPKQMTTAEIQAELAQYGG